MLQAVILNLQTFSRGDDRHDSKLGWSQASFNISRLTSDVAHQHMVPFRHSARYLDLDFDLLLRWHGPDRRPLLLLVLSVLKRSLTQTNWCSRCSLQRMRYTSKERPSAFHLSMLFKSVTIYGGADGRCASAKNVTRLHLFTWKPGLFLLLRIRDSLSRPNPKLPVFTATLTLEERRWGQNRSRSKAEGVDRETVLKRMLPVLKNHRRCYDGKLFRQPTSTLIKHGAVTSKVIQRHSGSLGLHFPQAALPSVWTLKANSFERRSRGVCL